MCGIFGVAGSNLSKFNLDRCVSLLKHRGPDDSHSVCLDESIFLGHTRLAVIDLSKNGRQPMESGNKKCWIVYNGEIYNHLELRKELENTGYMFKSKTDTEVILGLYETYGEKCLEKLNGMFAVAIYDKEKQKLFLARDRLGIKPLYYSFINGTFVFASEIKAILESNLIRKEINWQAIYDYFTFLFVPYPDTAFKHIKQLSPAHTLAVNLKSNDLQIDSYWNPYNESENDFTQADYNALKERLSFLIEDSVKNQLISDVPLGLFLSGGIDSSILAAIASKHLSKPLKTYTVRFDDIEMPFFDESKQALNTSQFLSTDHTELQVQGSSVEEIIGLIGCFDQPFANPTFYLSYLLSKLTKDHVTVALSGAGGDELFGGYPRYKALQYSKILQFTPKLFNPYFFKLAGLIKEDYNNPLPRRLKLFLRGIGEDLPSQYTKWTYFLSDDEKEQLLHSDFMAKITSKNSTAVIERYLNEAKNGEYINKIEYIDLHTFLIDNVLEYTDKTSMAVGLEARVPYLDHRIVEFSLQIPSKYKIKGSDTKVILKDIFKDMLPDELFNLPKKGFNPPISHWIEKHFNFYFEKILTSSYIEKQGIFNHDYISTLRKQHKSRVKDNGMELFSIIMFDSWYKKYIE